MTLDTGNFYWYGHPLRVVYALLERFAPRAVHTHIKNIAYPAELAETRREIGYEYGRYAAPLDEGNIAMDRVVGILRRAGYRGDLCIENEALARYGARNSRSPFCDATRKRCARRSKRRLRKRREETRMTTNWKPEPDRWRRAYAEDGYLVVENAVEDGLLQRLRDALERIEQAVADETLPAHLRRWVSLERDRTRGLSSGTVDSSAISNIMELPLFDPLFRDLIVYDRVLDILEALFESGEFAFHNYKCICKMPGGKAAFQWHRDLPYLQHSSPNLITCMLCVDPMTEQNGATVVCPGTHRVPHEAVSRKTPTSPRPTFPPSAFRCLSGRFRRAVSCQPRAWRRAEREPDEAAQRDRHLVRPRRVSHHRVALRLPRGHAPQQRPRPSKADRDDLWKVLNAPLPPEPSHAAQWHPTRNRCT
jgi:hypothetical protein